MMFFLFEVLIRYKDFMSCLQELLISDKYILTYQFAESLCLKAYLSCLYAVVFFQNDILSCLCVVLSCYKLTICVVWCLFNISCRNCRLPCLFVMLLCRNSMLSCIFVMIICRNTRLSYLFAMLFVSKHFAILSICHVIVFKDYAILSIAVALCRKTMISCLFTVLLCQNTFLNDSFKIPPLIG